MAKLLYPMNLEDFYTMAQCSIHSGDIDPIYPILKVWFEEKEMDTEQRLWCCLLYLYCYNLPWAMELYTRYSSIQEAYAKKIWEDKDLIKIKIGSDRRGILWSGGLAKALKNLVEFLKYRVLTYWLYDRSESWEFFSVNKKIRELPQSGVWSAFKYSDLITQTAHVPLLCTDLFIRERLAGPGEAILGLLGQDTNNHKYIKDNYISICNDLNDWSFHLQIKLKMKLSWFEIETVLCNYHSICVGSYYLGKDLDDMFSKTWDKIQQQKYMSDSDQFIFTARTNLFDKNNLIEYSNANGIKRNYNEDVKKYRIKCFKCQPSLTKQTTLL